MWNSTTRDSHVGPSASQTDTNGDPVIAHEAVTKGKQKATKKADTADSETAPQKLPVIFKHKAWLQQVMENSNPSQRAIAMRLVSIVAQFSCRQARSALTRLKDKSVAELAAVIVEQLNNAMKKILRKS